MTLLFPTQVLTKQGKIVVDGVNVKVGSFNVFLHLISLTVG